MTGKDPRGGTVLWHFREGRWPLTPSQATGNTKMNGLTILRLDPKSKDPGTKARRRAVQAQNVAWGGEAET